MEGEEWHLSCAYRKHIPILYILYHRFLTVSHARQESGQQHVIRSCIEECLVVLVIILQLLLSHHDAVWVNHYGLYWTAAMHAREDACTSD